MKSFKNRLGEDGTYRDFCRWYGDDCGDCFKMSEGDTFPNCYEPFFEESEAQSNKAMQPTQKARG